MPTTTTTNPFGAADSAVGYLYQIRIALLLTLPRLRASTDFMVSVEVIDDVAFEPNGEPAEILQAKHHRKGEANLTDASPDLWKSLRIWIEGRRAGSISAGSVLTLMTTSTAGVGSAASNLRRVDRDVPAAITALEATARTSTNADNKQAYTAFLSLQAQERLDLLNNVFVLDAAPDIEEVDQSIAVELFWAVERKYLESHLPTKAARLKQDCTSSEPKFADSICSLQSRFANIPPPEKVNRPCDEPNNIASLVKGTSRRARSAIIARVIAFSPVHTAREVATVLGNELRASECSTAGRTKNVSANGIGSEILDSFLYPDAECHRSREQNAGLSKRCSSTDLCNQAFTPPPALS